MSRRSSQEHYKAYDVTSVRPPTVPLDFSTAAKV